MFTSCDVTKLAFQSDRAKKKYVIAVLVQGRPSAGKIINLQQAVYIHDYSPHQVEQG
jgi:hypothetical protein